MTTGVPSALIFQIWDSAETGAHLFALLRAVPSLLTQVDRLTFDTAAREDGNFDLPTPNPSASGCRSLCRELCP